MRRKIKFISLFIVLALFFNIFAPTMNVLAQAPANTGDYGSLEIGGAVTSMEDVSNDNSVTVSFSNNNKITVEGNGLYSSVEGGRYFIYGNGEVTVTAIAGEGYTADLRYAGNLLGQTTANYTLENNNPVRVDGEFSPVETNPTPGSEELNNGTVSANINVSAGAGKYTMTRMNPETGLAVEQEVDYDDMADFYINGTMWNPDSETINYNSASEDTTVEFKFETLWIYRYYEDIVINGQSYKVSDYLDFDDRTEWLVANHGEQTLSFTIPNVTKADTYNIVVKHGENNGKKFLATFLWTADPAQAGGHDYIGNSKLEFVKAEYEVGNNTYTVTADGINDLLTKDGNHYSYHSQDGFLSYGVTADVDYDDGSLTLPGNAKVTMRVVPDYGYQVTSVNGGGEFTTTDEGISEFTVVVPEGAAGYFTATVEKVDDEVKATSTKVSSGNIEITKGDIETGTVRLSVDDITLTSDKISDLENAAGEYTISNYLDINLNNIFYQGTADKVWSKQIHHLKDEATITLKLEDGVNADDIVIVHNIDNGEKFEIIQIESYDPNTNTITFKTNSFSNFAIATKSKTVNENTESKEETKQPETTTDSTNPKTGDNIAVFIGIFIVAILALGVVVFMHAKNKTKGNK